MKNKRPKQIAPHHLERQAVVYVRLARYPDADGEKRIAAQRAQVKHARQWEWPEEQIVVLEEDMGKSGANPDRSGYRRMCQMIEAGDVGIVLVSDLARLSRSLAQLVDFLRLCERKDVLVAVDGILMNPSSVYLRESSPVQVEWNPGRTAYQGSQPERTAVQLKPAGWPKIREIFRRYFVEGKTCAEIAEEFNQRELKTTREGNGQ